MDVNERQPYLIEDNDLTYRLGAEFLEGLEVHDWGCGLGWMRNYVPEDKYVGVDETASQFADVVADLREYLHPGESIYMRHVLEHNEDWKLILANAVASFGARFCLVLYTPLADETHVHLVEPELDVPEIRFHIDDITQWLQGLTYGVDPVGSETIIRVTR